MKKFDLEDRFIDYSIRMSNVVDKIDNIRNDLNLDPSTLWSFKYSQLTHSILSVFNGTSVDIFLMKVLGETIYYVSFISIVSFLSVIMIKTFKGISKSQLV